jgi:hypothetical protein
MGEVRAINPATGITALAFSLAWPGATLRLLVDDEARVVQPLKVWRLVHRFELENRDLRLEVHGARFGAFWVRVEGSDQNRELSRLPRPNMLLREGGSSRRVALWWLNTRVDHLAYQYVLQGNRRLAYFCGATQKQGDPDHAQFPVPGTSLRNRKKPVPVLVEHLDVGEYRPREVVGRLKDPPPPKDWREGR